MPSRRVQSQAGTSLADVYDVKGSIAGIDALDLDEIKGVHDLGPQIHSERLNVFNLIADSGDVLQDNNFDITLGGFPDSVNRVLSIAVIADVAARLSFCAVMITDPGTLIDHPIWFWDSVNDLEGQARWNSPTGLTQIPLRPVNQVAGGVPTLLARTGADWVMPDVNFRGRTLGFGAGTVKTRMFMQVIRPDHGAPPPGAPSSHGLPVPSW